MTAQEPDRIRFELDGEIHALCTNPLADWLYERGIGSRSRGTGMWSPVLSWRAGLN